MKSLYILISLLMISPAQALTSKGPLLEYLQNLDYDQDKFAVISCWYTMNNLKNKKIINEIEFSSRLKTCKKLQHIIKETNTKIAKQWNTQGLFSKQNSHSSENCILSAYFLRKYNLMSEFDEEYFTLNYCTQI